MFEFNGDKLSSRTEPSHRQRPTVEASQQVCSRSTQLNSTNTQDNIEHNQNYLSDNEKIKSTTEYDLESGNICDELNSKQQNFDSNYDESSNVIRHSEKSKNKFTLNDAKSRAFTFFSVPNVPISTKMPHTDSSVVTNHSKDHRSNSILNNDNILNENAKIYGSINFHVNKQLSNTLNDSNKTKSCKHISNTNNGAEITRSDLQQSSTASRQQGASSQNSSESRPPGGPFEIIQIVPPMTSRRNSGAISPINFRSTPNNRRFASSNFRSIPELSSAQLNLNRSEQFQASASYALAHCNEEILCYYNRLVSLIGWRPLIQSVSCRSHVNWLIQTINWLYLAIIFVLLLSAYLLQFAACFRQDSIFVYDPLILGDETPPFLAYFERYKTSPTSTTSVSWTFRSPNSSEEEFPVVKQNVTTTRTTKSTKTTPLSTTTQKTTSHEDDDPPTDGVTFEGKVFPIIFTTATPAKKHKTINNLTHRTIELVNQNLLSVFYPFIERYSNSSFHNKTLSHHHEHLYRCRGGVGTYYIVPSLLHFIAFVSMLRQMRRPETDRFHNLCVVNYILDAKVSGRDRASNKLKTSIGFWMLIGIACLALTSFSHIFHLYFTVDDPVCYTFLQPTSDLGVNVLKASSMFLFLLIDFVCIAIFTTYALHCTLTIHFVRTNITALREKRIDFHEFAKNTEESKTSIDFLNCTHSIGVSILLIHFGTRLLVLLIDLCTKKAGLNLLTVTAFIYWIALVIVPLIQAARVTEACIALRHIGHELRARPFCYQSAPYHDLDSLLNYTSTLHMRAKLLLIPVRLSCVATVALTLIFVFLILGQIDLIQF